MQTIDIPVEEAINYWSGDRDDTFEYFYSDIIETCSEKFVENISRYGIRQPISLIMLSTGVNVINNGHHRLAAAWYLGLKTIPATYEKEKWESKYIMSDGSAPWIEEK